jgi:hypothetical protein
MHSDSTELKVGDEVFWLGSSPTKTYGQRRTPAKIIKICDDKKIQIKIDTGKGIILKFVAITSVILKS